MSPGAKTNSAPLWSNLSSFEGKFTVLKKVLVTLFGLFGASSSNSAPLQWFSVTMVKSRPGNCVPLAPSRYAPVFMFRMNPSKAPANEVERMPTTNDIFWFRSPAATWTRIARHGTQIHKQWQGPMKRDRVNHLSQWS